MIVAAERDEAIPASYTLVAQPLQSQAQNVLPPESQIHERIVPLWELEIDGQLKAPAYPVGVRIRRDDQLFLAENDALAVYGSGSTAEEAIADFKSVASAFAAEYRALGPDEVVGLGATVRENFLKAFPR